MSERNPISFRIPSERHHELLEQLTLQFGEPSPNAMARRILLQQLERPESTSEPEALNSLGADVAQIRQELSELRKDIALVAATLLAHAGKLTEREAVSWTDENLKSD